MARLNIALMLPGQASLGAFEAGAVGALLLGVQRINELDPKSVDIDVMTGASSGALTAMLATGVLLTGTDPVDALRQAWVSEPSLTALQGQGDRAPLSLDRAREVGRKLLARMLIPELMVGANRRRQREPVRLEFALTALRGFAYQLPGSDPVAGSGYRPSQRVAATSYIDWARYRFGRHSLKGFTEHWSNGLDAAIASASHPLVFAPVLLDRSTQWPRFRAHGVSNLPESQGNERQLWSDTALWYSDGGLVDREPLGRCLQLAYRRGAQDSQRLVLAVRPSPELAPAPDDDAWSGKMDPPRWRATLRRALQVMVTHSLYEDLRNVEKTNSRLDWIDQVVDAMTITPDHIGAAHPKMARKDRVTVAGRLRESQEARLTSVLEQIYRDKNHLREARQASPRERDAINEHGDDLVRRALRAASGLERKHRVSTQVVSAGDPSQLAGAASGFVSERLRATSFLVGYGSMMGWMDEGLRQQGVRERLVEEAVGEVRQRSRTIPGWVGDIPIRRPPPLRLSAQLLRVGARAVRVGVMNPRARERS